MEICDEEKAGDTMMCPQCDTFCPYWPLKDSCFLVKLTYIFDNFATIFFSIFMCVWGKNGNKISFYFQSLFSIKTNYRVTHQVVNQVLLT